MLLSVIMIFRNENLNIDLSWLAIPSKDTMTLCIVVLPFKKLCCTIDWKLPNRLFCRLQRADTKLYNSVIIEECNCILQIQIQFVLSFRSIIQQNWSSMDICLFILLAQLLEVMQAKGHLSWCNEPQVQPSMGLLESAAFFKTPPSRYLWTWLSCLTWALLHMVRKDVYGRVDSVWDGSVWFTCACDL